MKILAIETCGETGSVALLNGDAVFDTVAAPGTPHSGWVLPAVSRVLAEGGCTLGALDAIAFGAGPGAFTGLRLACGIAQGLGLAVDVPLVPVGSLSALAWQAGAGRWLVASDARMNEVYLAAAVVDDAGVSLAMAPRCLPPDQAVAAFGQFLDAAADDWRGAGNGFAAYGGEMAAGLGARLRAVDASVMSTARAVAQLARLDQAIAPELAAPLYVRDKVARTTAERVASGGRA